jgi:DNA-directed RNA polymerase sigma subunit (sigma70/sigma32)
MSTSDKDHELWHTWNASKSPQDLQHLVNHLNPLIQSEVNKRAGTLARPLLTTQAQVLTVKAINGFNPDMGVKLSTHVTNQLQKLSRVNYAHQNAARIPEHSMLQFHSVNIAKEDFRNEHGREPTTDELADTLKWSPKKVEQFNKQFARSELLESLESPAGMFVAAEHDPRIEYAYHSMSPRQQHIFEMITGYRGVPKKSNTQIMKELNITQGVLSYEKNKMRELLKAYG